MQDQDRIEQLDKQIMDIQKSTKTTFSFMFPLHEYLRLKYPAYYNWHLNNNHSFMHKMIAIFYTFAVFFIVTSVIFISSYNNAVVRASNSWTQSTDADFDAGTKTNVTVGGNSYYLNGETYSYSRDITINNTAGSELTDYQVVIDLNTGTNFDFSHAQSDGRDVRFVDANGEMLNYWIQNWDAVSARLWVKVTDIPAGENYTIKMYYGNDSVSAGSNGDNTFIKFDDFNDLSDWTVTGNEVTVADGIVTINNQQASVDSPQITQNFNISETDYVAEASYQQPSVYRNRAYITTSSLGCPFGGDYGIFQPSIYWVNAFTGTALQNNLWYVIQWINSPSDYIWKIFYNSVGYGEVSSQSRGSKISNLNYWQFAGTENTSSDFKLDWVRIRKYAATVPSTSVGSETSSERYLPGTFISSSYYTDGEFPDYGNIAWTNDIPEGTTLKFQIRSSSTEAGLESATWYGPTSADDYYTTNSGEAINSINDGDMYIQYKTYLDTNSTSTPTVSSVSITYDPENITINSDTAWSEDTYQTGNLTIANGATLTLAGGTTINVTGDLILDDADGATNIVCEGKNIDQTSGGVGCTVNVSGDTQIDASSNISANSEGYEAGCAEGEVGFGPGGGGSSSLSYQNGGGGAGHGANGGNGAWSTSGGSSYGSETQPSDLGSGGGGARYNCGGAGGGAIRLDVGGTLTLDGSITANGESISEQGSGSGGSIYITTNILAGSGTFSADGGSGGTYGGGGAGGRIAVYYYDSGTCGDFTIESSAGSGYAAGGEGTTVCGLLDASYMKFTTGDTSQTAGSGNNIVLTVYDNYGNIFTGYDGNKNITFSGANNAPDGTVPIVNGTQFGSSTTINFTEGVGATASMILYKEETSTIEATDGSVSTEGDPSYDLEVNVTDAGADHVDFTNSSGIVGGISTQTAGIAIPNLYVTALDTYDNIDENYSTGTVTLMGADTSAPGNAPDGTSPNYPDTSLTWGVDDTDGVMYFDSASDAKKVVLYARETGRMIKTVDSALSNNNSNAFDILPGSIESYSLSSASPQVAGVGFQSSIIALDNWENTVDTDSSTQVTMSDTGNANYYTNGTYSTLQPEEKYTLSSGIFTAYIKDTTAETIVITATDGNMKTGSTSSIVVDPNATTQVTISPDSAQTLTAGDTVSFSAQPKDEYGNNTTDSVTWTGTSAAGSGLFNDTTSGSHTVYATANSVDSDQVIVTVNPSETTQVTISPDSAQTLTAGDTVSFSAQPKDEYGNNTTDSVTWTGTSAAGSGLFNDTTSGDYTVYATANDINSDSVAVAVNPASASSFGLSVPEDATAGTEFGITVTAYDEYSNIDTNFSSSTTLSGLNNSPNGDIPVYGVPSFTDGVASVNITGYASGNQSITSTSGDVSGTSDEINFSPNITTQVTISPDSAQTITAGDTVSFSAQPKDEYGNNTTDSVTWTGTSATGSGLFNNTTSGSHTVYATANSVDSDQVQVTVDVNILDHVNLNPSSNQSYTAGGSVTYQASAYDEYNNEISEGVSYVWHGSDAANTGKISKTTAGSYEVYATGSEGATNVDSTHYNVTVSPASPMSIYFNSASQEIERGEASNKITLKFKDRYSNVITASDNTYAVSLSSSSSSGQFSLSKDNFSSTNSVNLNKGSSSAEFYYKDQTAGKPTITAARSGWTSASQDETIKDTVAPSPPTVSTPQNGQIYTDTHYPIFSGTAETNTRVIIAVGGSEYITNVDSEGKFDYTLTNALADGEYTAQLKTRDNSGNDSSEVSVSFKMNTGEYVPDTNEDGDNKQSAQVSPTAETSKTDIVYEKVVKSTEIEVDNIPITIRKDSKTGLPSVKVFPEKTISLRIDLRDEDKDVTGVNVKVNPYYQLEEVEDNVFEGEIISPKKDGEYQFRMEITYSDGEFEERPLGVLVDPYGYVYAEDLLGQQRIKDVEVSIYTINENDNRRLWDADKYDQQNPQLTDEAGEYGFMVPEGKYYLVAKKDGFYDYQSEILDIDEGDTVNINIELKSKEGNRNYIVYIAIVILMFILGFVVSYFVKRKRTSIEDLTKRDEEEV